MTPILSAVLRRIENALVGGQTLQRHPVIHGQLCSELQEGLLHALHEPTRCCALGGCVLRPECMQLLQYHLSIEHEQLFVEPNSVSLVCVYTHEYTRHDVEESPLMQGS